MIACPQTSVQNVLQHGKAVAEVAKKLYCWLEEPYEEVSACNRSCNCKDWVLKENPYKPFPQWMRDYREEILDAFNEYDWEQIEQYHIYHDCGKPFCRSIDDQGKQHFPNHANISAQVFEDTFGSSIVSTWIKHDMDAHVLKAVQVPEFCSIEGCVILLVTALAEIYANASMFGGTTSTSFKIKYKQLDRRGKAICKYLWGQHG